MENKKYDTFGTFSKSNIKLEEWDQTDNPATDKFMTTQPISTTQDYSCSYTCVMTVRRGSLMSKSMKNKKFHTVRTVQISIEKSQSLIVDSHYAY
jgi:hypothetical protein